MPQVFLEILRLYPPAPATVREAPEGLTLSGYEIPKGTPITVNKVAIYCIHVPNKVELCTYTFVTRSGLFGYCHYSYHLSVHWLSAQMLLCYRFPSMQAIIARSISQTQKCLILVALTQKEKGKWCHWRGPNSWKICTWFPTKWLSSLQAQPICLPPL